MYLRGVSAVLAAIGLVVTTCSAMPLSPDDGVSSLGPLRRWISFAKKTPQNTPSIEFFITYSKEKPPLTPETPLGFEAATDKTVRNQVIEFITKKEALLVLGVTLPNSHIDSKSPDYAEEVNKVVKFTFNNKFPFANFGSDYQYVGDAASFILYGVGSGAKACTKSSPCIATVGISLIRGSYGKIQQQSGQKSVIFQDQERKLTGLPSSLTVTHSNNSLRIGLIHGHQSLPLGSLDALSAIARQMDVDFLISGATHAVQAAEYDGRFFLNPGTATGAWTGAWNGSKPGFAVSTNEGVKSTGLNGDPIPSFALMDIQGTVVVTYVYQFIDGDVKVEKVEWRKPDGYGVDERVGAKTPMTPGVGSVMPQTIPSPTPMSPQNAGW
ncbi:Metallo-dependent phosphatase-like protein [Lentinula boryana]|uniref:Vacuolar protein sorting-associated protein 29 n=1 Tax=Lentinula boryana TaxID=40481 RepID=A0ABQ8QTX4_9AGAR|nr:Metallo-dependent phosphatase-like protein [Lentinula boryana]